MNRFPEYDQLIERLQSRVANPERRTDFTPSRFDERLNNLSLGSILFEGLNIAKDLRRVVQANQQGEVPEDLISRADDIADEMMTPASSDLPPRATPSAMQSAESELEFRLPDLMRRLYVEVADGGFGPACGLLSLSSSVELYKEMRSGGAAPEGLDWPQYLLPVLEDSAVLICVDAASPEGRVIVWDPEGLEELTSAAEWARCFRLEATSLDLWLQDWLDAPSAEQQVHMMFGDQIMASQIETARQSRERIAAMTPEERAAIGLPEVGWERVVWGGLGREPEQE